VTRQLYADLDPDDLAIARGVLTQITERAQRLRSELWAGNKASGPRAMRRAQGHAR
jgi:hypothetical protein